ncbi:MAG: ECF-type sigma factor [Planctomycetota bacterium]
MQRFEELLAVGERHWGPEHPKLLNARQNYATVLRDVGRYTEAAELTRQVYESRQKGLGEEHADTLFSLQIMCVTLLDLGRSDEAVGHARALAELTQRARGPDNVATAGGFACYAEQQDPRMAEIVMLRHFAGLGVDETAAALAVSPRTVKREWAVAKAWLFQQLADGSP